MPEKFCNLFRKDFQMMLAGKFFLLALLSLLLYSGYINLLYVGMDQEIYPVYLYDPQGAVGELPEYVVRVKSRKELEEKCGDGYAVGADASGKVLKLEFTTSGLETTDNLRAAFAKAVLSGETGGRSGMVGEYTKEEKNRREMAAECLFFELSAVGFLGLASMLFKEKQMGVLRVHGVLPVGRPVFILSKVLWILAADLLFTALLTVLNVGVREGLSVLPGVLLQSGILSVIMALAGFYSAVRVSDFKQFSLLYLVLAVFVTSPVFLAGQTGISWDWIDFHPMYHLFLAMKSAYFRMSGPGSLYYLRCILVIGGLFCLSDKALKKEMEKEG